VVYKLLKLLFLTHSYLSYR